VPQVFFLTAAFSLFAYVWLVVILVAITPNVVDVWEAVLTFLFFPVLVILAYVTDKSCFRRRPSVDGKPAPGEEQTLKSGEGANESHDYSQSRSNIHFYNASILAAF
jgi:solute carrier family 8 (sodium/calcium exchanger)